MLSPIDVNMPDGSTYHLTHLLSLGNHKQQKSTDFLSMGLILAPRTTADILHTVCPHATPGCAGACFADRDRLRWLKNKWPAIARTRFLAERPDVFRSMLIEDLERALETARRRHLPLVCRLNVVSDVPFERLFPDLFKAFPEIVFMDYTKDPGRVLDRSRPPNYWLTFSRSERNEEDCRRVLAAGRNVTVVFRRPPFPPTFWGYPVIDGDVHDLRFLDPTPCVVALKAKGKGARTDASGFVVDYPPQVNFVLLAPAARTCRMPLDVV